MESENGKANDPGGSAPAFSGFKLAILLLGKEHATEILADLDGQSSTGLVGCGPSVKTLDKTKEEVNLMGFIRRQAVLIAANRRQ